MSTASMLVSFEDQARIEALRRITPADVIDADIVDDVRAALSSPTVEVRCVALRTWARCGLPSDETTRQNLIHRDARVRMATLVALSCQAGELAAAACRMALRDPEHVVVLVALHCVLRSHLAIPTDAVALLLDDDDWRVRVKAALIVLRDGDPRGSAVVADLLNHGSTDQQQFIIRLIGTARLCSAIELIRPFLVHGNTFLKDVIQTYGLLGDRQQLRPLMSFLCSVHTPIRLAAQTALIAIGDVSIAETLAGALADPRSTVQQSAVHILVALDQDVPTPQLGVILERLPEDEIRPLLSGWLRGPVDTVIARITQLHAGVQTALSTAIQRAVRHAIYHHPDSDAVLAGFHQQRSVALTQTLKPFFHEERLPLPATDFLVTVLHVIDIRRQTLLWQRMLQQLRRDGVSSAALVHAVPAYAAGHFYEECGEIPDERCQVLLRTAPGARADERALRALIRIVTRMRGYAAQLSVDTVAWLATQRPSARDTDQVMIDQVIADWEAFQHGTATIAPVLDVLHDSDALAQWWDRTPAQVANMLRRWHSNPFVTIDDAARATMRDVIERSIVRDETIELLRNPTCPSVALTLLPWFVDGTLPAPHHAVLMGMRELADCAHAEIDELIRQCEAAYPQHQTTGVTLLRRHAADAAADAPTAPSQSR